MERQSEAEDAADRALVTLNAKCGSPTSTHSRRAVVMLTALSPDDKTLCVVNCAEHDLGNLVRCAVAAGVSADTLWGEGNVPLLCVAAQHGSSCALRALLAGGANHALTDARGCTAMHHAAFAGDTASLRLLLQAGAQLEATTCDGFTPLMAAAQEGHAEACQLLLSAGALLAAYDASLQTPVLL